MKRTPRTTLGASLSISAPTGQYDPDKLINIGTNRWAFKPEIGLTIPHGPWMFDVFAGVWLFSANPDFFGGVHREQDPMPTLQGHVSYTFRPQAVAGARQHVLLRRRNQRQRRSSRRPEGKLPRRPDILVAGGKETVDQVQLEPGRDRAPRQQLHHLRHRLAVHLVRRAPRPDYFFLAVEPVETLAQLLGPHLQDLSCGLGVRRRGWSTGTYRRDSRRNVRRPHEPAIARVGPSRASSTSVMEPELVV